MDMKDKHLNLRYVGMRVTGIPARRAIREPQGHLQGPEVAARRTGRAGDTDRHRVYGIKMGMGVTYGAKRNRLEVRRLLIMSYQGIIHEYRK